MLVMLRRMSGGAILARMCRFSVVVGLKQPVMSRHVAFSEDFNMSA